jgi:hypothetical protein
MVFAESGQIAWIHRPSLHLLAQTFTEIGNGRLGLLIVLVLAGVSVPGSWTSRSGADRLSVAGAFLLPPTALWIAGRFFPSFLDRYVVCSTIGAVGGASIGLASPCRGGVHHGPGTSSSPRSGPWT